LEFISNGKIEFSKNNEKIVYHDPCELSRLGGVIEEPRKILNTLTGSYIELPESGRDARCCGGGGSYQAIDDKSRLSIGGKRIRQIEKIDPEILTSACPNCKITLGESARQEGVNIRVMDIVELIASRIRVEEP
jgi:Fe-S oxidoreductase